MDGAAGDAASPQTKSRTSVSTTEDYDKSSGRLRAPWRGCLCLTQACPPASFYFLLSWLFFVVKSVPLVQIGRNRLALLSQNSMQALLQTCFSTTAQTPNSPRGLFSELSIISSGHNRTEENVMWALAISDFICCIACPLCLQNLNTGDPVRAGSAASHVRRARQYAQLIFQPCSPHEYQ